MWGAWAGEEKEWNHWSSRQKSTRKNTGSKRKSRAPWLDLALCATREFAAEAQLQYGNTDGFTAASGP